VSGPTKGRSAASRFNACVIAFYGLFLVVLAPALYRESGHFYMAMASAAYGLLALAYGYRVLTGLPGVPVRYQAVLGLTLGVALISRGAWLCLQPRKWEAVPLFALGALALAVGWRRLLGYSTPQERDAARRP
jgi:hypothetical protein